MAMWFSTLLTIAAGFAWVYGRPEDSTVIFQSYTLAMSVCVGGFFGGNAASNYSFNAKNASGSYTTGKDSK